MDPLSTLEQIDLSDIVLLDESALLQESLSVFIQKKIAAVGVIDSDGKIVGVMSETDLIRKVGVSFNSLKEKPISEFMTRNPFCLTVKDTFSDCILLMSKREFRHIPLLDEDGTPTKMISINELILFVTSCYEEFICKFGVVTDWNTDGILFEEEDFVKTYTETLNPIELIFTAPVRQALEKRIVMIDHSSSMIEVITALCDMNVGAAVLTEFETKVVGILTERDIVHKLFSKIELSDPSLLVSNFMTKDPHLLKERHIIAHAINNMSSFEYRSNIIVDEDGMPVSVLTILDILKFIAKGLGIYNPLDE